MLCGRWKTVAMKSPQPGSTKYHCPFPPSLLHRALFACLVLSAGWLGCDIYLTAPLIAGWQLWLIASLVLLIATIAMMAWFDGEDPEGADL